MKSDRCQNNCCQKGSCSMSAFVEAVYPVEKQNDGMLLQDRGQAQACSLPEIASLVELARIGSMAKEEAILAADPDSIGSILREAEPFSTKDKDLAAPKCLLEWCDNVRELKILAEDAAYLPQQAEGVAGLLLMSEADWLAGGHLKELFEEWTLQYADDRPGGQQYPDMTLRERLLYRWKGHLETVLHHLDDGVLSVALVTGIDRLRGHAREAESLSDLRDIQLEALFRAVLACERQELAHKLEILVPYPTCTEEWNFAHDLIERVAEETYCYQRRVVSCSIGALVEVDIDVRLAADLAKGADLIVMDSSENAHTWSQNVSGRIEALARQIRKSNSRLSLRVSGLRDTADLPAIYRAGIEGIGAASNLIPAFRLAAAQFELNRKARKQEKAY